jgi:alanyl-tRNA synthetase
VHARVDAATRQATVLNHSATHLLHAALRTVLGDHVTQKGSLVAPDRLRFDFSHHQPVTADELEQIEALVNEQIRRNAEAETAVMDFEAAVAAGAMALFGEKYDARVRVLRIGDFSTELCGGTHVTRAGDIGLLKITSEAGIAAGVRRIEAVTGDRALAWVRAGESALGRIAGMMRATREEAEDKVRHLLDRSRQLERELEQLKARLASGQSSDLADRATEVGGIKVLAARVDGADPKALREAVDRLKQRLGTAVVVLGSVEDDKARLVAGVTGDVTDRIKAGALVGEIAPLVGGRGGGRPDMAQAGGSDPAGMDAALERVPAYVAEQIG